MAYGDGPKFGMISDNWIYDIGDAGSIGDRFRNKLSIDQTATIPWTHFIARIKAGHAKRKYLKMSRVAIKWMRRFQAQKIVLDAINDNANVYGDQIKSRSKLSAKKIQEMITKENLASTYNDSPYESDNITKYNKFIAFKTAISRGFWEKFYINRFKFKAFRKYNKKSKRDQVLIDVKHEIDYHRQLLHNHLFHNYNVAAVNCGKLKKEDGYEGLFPDKIDMDVAKKYGNTGNSIPNNTTATNSDTNTNEKADSKEDIKVIPTEVVNVNENKKGRTSTNIQTKPNNKVNKMAKNNNTTTTYAERINNHSSEREPQTYEEYEKMIEELASQGAPLVPEFTSEVETAEGVLGSEILEQISEYGAGSTTISSSKSKSRNSKVTSKETELLEMLGDYNSINHGNDDNNINKGKTR